MNLTNPSISTTEQGIADQALSYRFYVKNFSESEGVYYNFSDGKGGINWDLTVPGVSDQEFRYQRHRHQWMEPQARAYYIKKDDKYAKCILDVLHNWYETYPVPEGVVYPTGQNDVDYQWKGLQVSERLMNAFAILDYCKAAPSFTADELCFMLEKLAQSVEVVRLNYYQESNILISQLQAVGFAGVLYPEFKNASTWAQEGYSRLGEQIQQQFLDDGMHYELDPSYHIAAIADYREAVDLANANNVAAKLGATGWIQKMYKGAKFVQDITFPDYSIENFNDTRNSSYSKSVLTRNFGYYAAMFPQDGEFTWMAKSGSSGTKPTHRTAYYKNSGYYVMRNGWDASSTVMILKNNYNPDNKWHCQPDNGTFAIWRKGRNFFPDAGCYTYGGSSTTNAQRNAYRATTNHNTVTINNKTIDGNHMLGQFVTSASTASYEMVRTSNVPMDGFNHTRTAYSFGGDVFVFVDEISGSGTNPVYVHMHMLSDDSYPTVYEDRSASKTAGLHTTFADGNNMLVRTFPLSQTGYSCAQLSSNISNKIDVVSGKRVGYRVGCTKAAGETVRFVSVAAGVSSASDSTPVSASLSGSTLTVTVSGTTYTAQY